MNAKKVGRSRKDSANLCVVCFEEYEFYAIGSCDHVVCYRCCVRMRVLGEEKYCPVCRADLDKVFLSTSWHSYAEVSLRAVPLELRDKKYGIVYETQQIKNKVKELLQHKCSLCSEGPSCFQIFPQLRDHMKKLHQLYYCDLCVDHLRKFSHERKAYNRPDLARHRRIGDVDDTSHKGHPLCQFCDIRFLDNDELHRHLRKEHYYCHICEKFGSQEYFPNYDILADHFRSEHFLCEEGECLAEKFIVFSTKIDMQAHVASKHSQKLSKAQARQARQLEVDIQFAPRPKPQRRTVSGRDYCEIQSAEQSHRYSRNRNREQDVASDRGMMEDYQQAIMNSLADPPRNCRTQSSKSKHKNNKKSKPDKQPEQEVNNQIDMANGQPRGASVPLVSRQTEEQPNVVRNRAAVDEFPSLQPFVQVGTWQSNGKPKGTTAAGKQATIKSGSFSNPQSYGLDQDFPSLNSNSKGPTPTSKPPFPPGFSKAISQPPGLAGDGHQKNAPPGVGSPPGLGKVPSTASLNKAPPDLSKAPSDPRNILSDPRNAPPGLSKAPSDLRNTLSDPRKAPPGLGRPSDVKENITPVPAMIPQPQVKQQLEPKLSSSVQERNQNLVETIRKLLSYNKDKFAEFKALSGSFRKGVCSAGEYYARCCDLFESNIGSVFNELVDLLPDREKQEELLRARQNAKIKAKQEGKATVKQKGAAAVSAWSAGPGLPVAQTSQVPQAPHVLQGPLAMSNQDFPSLPSASKSRLAPRMYKPNRPSAPLKSAWVRGK